MLRLYGKSIILKIDWFCAKKYKQKLQQCNFFLKTSIRPVDSIYTQHRDLYTLKMEIVQNILSLVILPKELFMDLCVIFI
jgi:hypothetical protein